MSAQPSSEQVALWSRRIQDKASSIAAEYANAQSFAFALGRSGSEPTSGGPMPDPTVTAAMDMRRAIMRLDLEHVWRILKLMESAADRALEEIRAGERTGRDTLGDSGIWTAAGAERAERRATERRRSGIWRPRPPR